MDGDAIVFDIERDVGRSREILLKELLDHLAFVAAADHEFVEAVVRVRLHDVPQDRPAADLDHRLRANARFFRDPRPETASQDHYLHVVPLGTGLPSIRQREKGEECSNPLMCLSLEQTRFVERPSPRLRLGPSRTTRAADARHG
jgi:hypothetical protein